MAGAPAFGIAESFSRRATDAIALCVELQARLMIAFPVQQLDLTALDAPQTAFDPRFAREAFSAFGGALESRVRIGYFDQIGQWRQHAHHKRFALQEGPR